MPSALRSYSDWTPWGEPPFAGFPGTVTSFSFAAEGEALDVLRRFIGCLLMMAMPEPGLEEALGSLEDVFESSWRMTYGLLPHPATTRRWAGRLVGVSDRPDLVISE